MKKALSIIVSLVMLLSSFSCISAFATEGDTSITDVSPEVTSAFETFLKDNELIFNPNYFFLAKLPESNTTTDPTSFVLKIETTASENLELALGYVDATTYEAGAIPSANTDNPLELNVVAKEVTISASQPAEVYVVGNYSMFTNDYIGISIEDSSSISKDFSITMTPMAVTAEMSGTPGSDDFKLNLTVGEAIATAVKAEFDGPITFEDSSLAKMGAVLTSLDFGTSVSYDNVVAALADITTDAAKAELNETITDEQISALAEIIANGNSGKAITTNSGVVTIPNIALAVAPAAEGTVYTVEATKVETTEETPEGTDDIVAYDIKIKADGIEVSKPIVAQKVMVDLPNGWNTSGVKVKHGDTWSDVDEVVNGKIVFTTDSFSTFTLAGVNAVANEDTRADEVKFEIVQDETNKNKFSLLITPTSPSKQIIKFAAAAMKYDFRKGSIADDEVMKNFTYKLTEVEGISIKMIDENAKYNSDSIGGFSFIATAEDGNLLTVAAGESIKVADIEITGKGKIDVSTDSFENDDKIYFETDEDNEVDPVKVFSTYSNPTTIDIPEITYDLTINVDFGLNRIETTDADYLGMTVTLKGSITKEEIVLSIGDEIAVTLDEVNQKASATGKVNLPANESYTFAIEGLGYRTYRGSVYLDENKTINLWNNAKTSGSVNVIADDDTTAKDVTFLVGDIYMDGIVDIYDLSAATSYYGAENIDKANTNVYACDLNRDGKITIADIAYVQVSYGN